jgi:hypothetical protein
MGYRIKGETTIQWEAWVSEKTRGGDHDEEAIARVKDELGDAMEYLDHEIYEGTKEKPGDEVFKFQVTGHQDRIIRADLKEESDASGES